MLQRFEEVSAIAFGGTAVTPIGAHIFNWEEKI